MRFPARLTGARSLGRRFLRAAGLVGPTLHEELLELAPVHSRIYKRVAPRREGKLAEQIRPEPRGIGYDIISPVRSEDGFPYTGVTRFGHLSQWIYPKGQALRFTIGGRVIFARRVRGYHPPIDWADLGLPEAEAEASRAASRIGRRIVMAL